MLDQYTTIGLTALVIIPSFIGMFIYFQDELIEALFN